MILMVTYDLHNPGRDYPAVEKQLQSASGGAKHPQGSVWILDTLKSCTWWRDQLQTVGDANDEFLVVRMEGSWASAKMDTEVANWLKSGERRW